jgi:hypothetical protein
MGGTCSIYGRVAKGVHYFGGTPETKRMFGRTRLLWEDNIKKNYKERGQEHAHWIYQPGSCEYGNEVFGFVKCTKLFDLLRESKL